MKLICSILGLMTGLILAGGCGPKAQVSDEVEREMPVMKKARTLEEAGDLAGAIVAYQSVLDRDPTVARAHLSMAFLVDKPGGDYVAALYHYRRYLALRPDTEKRRMIEDHIRATTLAHVATVFKSQSAMLTRMAEVETENSGLKVKVNNLEAQTMRLRAMVQALQEKYAATADAASRALDGAALPVPGPRVAGKTVTVGRGDTLRKIAGRAYGDEARWREIYEANRRTMRHANDLKVGQVLLVPVRESE